MEGLVSSRSHYEVSPVSSAPLSEHAKFDLSF